MNYVKHLSIALLVLSASSMVAMVAPVDPVNLPANPVVNPPANPVVNPPANPVVQPANPPVQPVPAGKVWPQSFSEAFTWTYWKSAGWQPKAALGAGLAAIVAGLYKTVPAVQDAIDNTAESVKDFAVAVKEDTGNARRNLALGTAVVLAAGTGAHYYAYGKLPFCK